MSKKRKAVEKKEKADDEPEEEEAEEEEEKAEKELEEDIVEERIYTIPLRQAWISPVKKRSPRAMRIIKSFMNKHMKPETLIISNELNEEVWSRGIEKPPRKIRVRAARDKDGVVTVYLAEGG